MAKVFRIAHTGYVGTAAEPAPTVATAADGVSPLAAENNLITVLQSRKPAPQPQREPTLLEKATEKLRGLTRSPKALSTGVDAPPDLFAAIRAARS